MFTGIVEEFGTIEAIEDQGDAIRLTIASEITLSDAGLGDSIAVNGCCLRRDWPPPWRSSWPVPIHSGIPSAPCLRPPASPRASGCCPSRSWAAPPWPTAPETTAYSACVPGLPRAGAEPDTGHRTNLDLCAAMTSGWIPRR